MLRSTIVFLCCCLIGCDSGPDQTPSDFKERQEQLFYGIDHKLVYQSCQQLMRLHREGRLSRTTFYGDDPKTSQNELPESIRLLQPTYVRVDEIMVDISFSSEDGTQLLRCMSNEFREPPPSDGDSKGFGFRKDPFGMDKLSGTEPLHYLNETFDHFQMELIPGLTYERYTAEQATPPEKIKESNEMMEMLMDHMMKTVAELAVKKQRLLYQTDHHELLKACREIIMRYNDGVFSTDQIIIGDYRFAKDLNEIPQIILSLEPVSVWIEKNSVMVALIAGLDHAGVVAYMNNEEAVARDEDMKLIDGLLYYDDGLREADDDYKEYLDSLRDEAIPYLDWKRKQMNLPIPKRMKYRK